MLIACGGDGSSAVDAAPLVDGATTGDAPDQASDAAPAVDATPPIDPAVEWGAAATGCPTSQAGTAIPVLSARIDLRWNADVSFFPGQPGASQARSLTPINDDEFGGLATLTPNVAADVVDLAPVFIALGQPSLVYAGSRSVGDVTHFPGKVCLEGVASADVYATDRLVIYASDLAQDSHAASPALTLVMAPTDGVILTYPTVAEITLDPAISSTAPIELGGGSNQSQRTLGSGGSPAYVTVAASPAANAIHVVRDRR